MHFTRILLNAVYHSLRIVHGVMDYGPWIYRELQAQPDDLATTGSFKTRIRQAEDVITPVFNPNHRERMRGECFKRRIRHAEGCISWIFNHTHRENIRRMLARTNKRVVTFVPHVQVLTMHRWAYAYRQARIGTWLQDACDRARFNERIRRLDDIISSILEPAHRNRIRHSRLSS